MASIPIALISKKQPQIRLIKRYCFFQQLPRQKPLYSLGGDTFLSRGRPAGLNLNKVNTFHITHSQAPCSRHLSPQLAFNRQTLPFRGQLRDTYSSKGFTNRPPTRSTAHRCRARSNAASGSSFCASTRVPSSSWCTAWRKFFRRRISERRAVSEMMR